ncbi:hypothetical protein AAC387_Pa06g0403 [Persea americana]
MLRYLQLYEIFYNLRKKYRGDEVDTETESEDEDAKEIDMNQARRMQGKQSTAPIQVSAGRQGPCTIGPVHD